MLSLPADSLLDFTSHPIPLDDDKFREECGVFGVFGHPDAAALTALGLHALQHRGQEACGIVALNQTPSGAEFLAHRALGLVGDQLNTDAVIRQLKGNVAIGHNRYATTGGTLLRNVQPLFAEFEFGGFAVAHNGNLTNAQQLKQQLVRRGSIFQSTTDTETIIHLIATARSGRVVERLIEALRQVEGAYSLVTLSADTMIGVRDPHGVRPLVLGRLGEAYILASETCALDIIGADFVRDIEAGEMVLISKDGIESLRPFQKQSPKFCVFEYIYFSRPDSQVEGLSVYEARKKIGIELARESGVTADVVVPVPDSGVPAAIGYAQASGLPFELGIIRNHYVGRTFIEPTDHIRNLGVRLKHNTNRRLLEDKRVVLVDDSIVRGTTSKKIVAMVREAGATEIHMRISSPPTTHSCFYGIDTPDRKDLMAANLSVDEMAKAIGVDSLAFLSLDALYRAMGKESRDNGNPQYCDACFSGEYAIRPIDYEAGSNIGSNTDTMQGKVRSKAVG